MQGSREVVDVGEVQKCSGGAFLPRQVGVGEVIACLLAGAWPDHIHVRHTLLASYLASTYMI